MKPKHFTLLLILLPFFVALPQQNDEYHSISEISDNAIIKYISNTNYVPPIPLLMERNFSLNSVFLFPQTFGFTSLYSKKINYNTYITGELGMFFNSNFNPYQKSYDSDAESHITAQIFPLYIGIKKYLMNYQTPVLPYITSGVGIAFGYGIEYSESDSYLYGYGVTPTAYFGIGANINVSRRMWIDFEIRPRLLRFFNKIGDWKDFSGISLLLGFSYGI